MAGFSSYKKTDGVPFCGHMPSVFLYFFVSFWKRTSVPVKRIG